MGFRCPRCHKDFGIDKEELAEHIISTPACAIYAATVLSTIKEAINNINKEELEQ